MHSMARQLRDAGYEHHCGRRRRLLSRSLPCQRDDDGRRPADRYVVALDDFLSKIDRNWMVPDEHNWVPFDPKRGKASLDLKP
jgi:hypothetical protein